MFSYIVDWLELGIRWLHVVAGITWIGVSFYFMWLDGVIRLPQSDIKDDRAQGEVWEVHGGGFYSIKKFVTTPVKLPQHLHWFMWEAYITGISGVALLIVVYYMSSSTLLLDTSKLEALNLPVWSAIVLAALSIPVGWVIYHYLLCRTVVMRNQWVLLLVGIGLLTVFTFGLDLFLSNRATYIHVGSMLGAIMVGNVFFVIIPNQRRIVNAMLAGKSPDPSDGTAGKVRSVHNNYLTLPMIFTMISTHYPMTFGHQWSWLILIGIMLLSGIFRHFFNLRNIGRRDFYIIPAMVVVGAIVLIYLARPQTIDPGDQIVAFAEVNTIVQQRCAVCHSASPSYTGYSAPPKGVVFDTPEDIRNNATLIRSQSVNTTAMPLGNLTNMTAEERALLGVWIAQGANLTP